MPGKLSKHGLGCGSQAFLCTYSRPLARACVRALLVAFVLQVVEANQGVVRLIRGDYPAGMANTVYDCLEAEQVGTPSSIRGA